MIPACDPVVLSRRAWLTAAGSAVVAVVFPRRAFGALTSRARGELPAPDARTLITVFKDPLCGCCQQWVTHMAAAGFRPAVQDVADLDAVKQRYGVPASLHACHTAVVNGYVIEGHVPAADVRRLLRDRSPVGARAVRGLAVPGMPAGSPGMESNRTEAYTVFAFDPAGATTRFASH
ncbi:hypothetical protein tb265_24460 [Gemmatimonadetes bacterium T265]|nr:hypothetical protein tb265_24460 [Gemmatimonadetes bacterium T265]